MRRAHKSEVRYCSNYGLCTAASTTLKYCVNHAQNILTGLIHFNRFRISKELLCLTNDAEASRLFVQNHLRGGGINTNRQYVAEKPQYK